MLFSRIILLTFVCTFLLGAMLTLFIGYLPDTNDVRRQKRVECLPTEHVAVLTSCEDRKICYECYIILNYTIENESYQSRARVCTKAFQSDALNFMAKKYPLNETKTCYYQDEDRLSIKMAPYSSQGSFIIMLLLFSLAVPGIFVWIILESKYGLCTKIDFC